MAARLFAPASQPTSKPASKPSSGQASQQESKRASKAKHDRQSKQDKPPKQASKQVSAQPNRQARYQPSKRRVIPRTLGNRQLQTAAGHTPPHATPWHATPHQAFSQEGPRPHRGLSIYFHSHQESRITSAPTLVNTLSPLQVRGTITARFASPRPRGLTAPVSED